MAHQASPPLESSVVHSVYSLPSQMKGKMQYSPSSVQVPETIRWMSIERQCFLVPEFELAAVVEVVVLVVDPVEVFAAVDVVIVEVVAAAVFTTSTVTVSSMLAPF